MAMFMCLCGRLKFILAKFNENVTQNQSSKQSGKKRKQIDGNLMCQLIIQHFSNPVEYLNSN